MYVDVCSSKGAEFGFQTLFQKENIYYIGLIDIACQVGGLGTCPQRIILEPNCLQC